MSKTLCLTLCLIVEQKAAGNIADGALLDKIHHTLASFGISKDQFYEVEKELGEV